MMILTYIKHIIISFIQDSEADNHKANNRKLLEDFERKSEVGLSRPVSQNGEAEGISRPSGRPVHRSTREK